MPTFTFTDDKTGKTKSIVSDTVPTEQELIRLFEEDQRPSFAATPYGVGGGMTYDPSVYKTINETTANALRYGAPAVAAMGTGGASLLAQAAIGGAVSGAGELGASAVEGKDLTSPEVLGETAKAIGYNVIPVRRAAKVLETAASLGAGAALAESLGALVGGELRSTDQEVSGAAKQKAIESGVISSLIGVGLGGLGKVTGSILASAQENANKRQFLDEIGIKNPALSQIIPEYAPITNRMAARDPELANKLASTESGITKELFGIVGDIPSNSDVAAKMAPLVQTATAAENAIKQAKAQQAQAKSRLAALEAAPAQSSSWQEAYESAALESLNAARKQAEAKFAAQQGFGTAASITSHADDLTKTIIDLDGAVGDVSKSLYSKTGLNPAQEVVSREALLRSARSTLKDEVRSDVGQSIINAIENVGKIGDEAPAMLSWNQFKELRDKMSNSWANFGTSYKSNAERMASSVYQNLGGVFRNTIKETVGPENAKAYDAAQKFWREWSKTRDSDFTSAIFNSQRKLDAAGREVVSGITPATLNSVADGVLKGDVTQVRNVVNAIDLVGKYSPEAADSMRASVGRSIRGAMIDKYRNDPAGLITALAEQASKEDVRPFIQMAGFGTKKNLDSLAKVVKQYSKEDITPQVIDEALAAGDSVLGVGKGVMKKKAQEAAALAVAGVNEKASKKLTEARQVAQKANLAADEALNTFNETVNNPIFSVFTGRGKYAFTEEAGRTGKGTISDFVMSLSPDAGQRFMGALRKKDPQFADLVSRKILADELYRISGIDRNSVDAATKVDFDKLRRMFKPSLPQDVQRADHLRLVVGDVMDSRMKRFLSNFEKVSPSLKEAKLIKQETSTPIISTGLGAIQGFSNIFPGLSSLGAAVLATRFGRIIEKPRFDLLTYMATDPSFLNIATKSDKFSKAIQTLPLQRSYLYLVNSGLSNDMADMDATQAQPTR